MPATEKSPLSRRDFLQAGLIGGAGAVLIGPGILRGAEGAAEAAQGVCLTVCNHWSYIGIGWQLGIESCVLSVTDAMEMADRPPHVKTCINLDARAYEFMAEKFPEIAERLKQYLRENKVELIGGTYGQPMGTMFGGESNIRQIVMGREIIRKVLDYELVTFLEEEEFTHPQIPQLAAGAGFRYASLAQLDTWGRAGCPVMEENSIAWKGIDGTTIPTIPRTSLFGFSVNAKELATSAALRKLQALGKPLVFAWEEFGWDSPEQPAYLTAPAKYKEVADQMPVEFVTCKDYLDKYGANPKEVVLLPMDAWDKSLTWGLGGDQLRILDRKVEGLLLAAERFDAVASSLGAASQVNVLEEAWKDLLASQSHDVGLCEYSKWQGWEGLGGYRMAPLDRIEDFHNFTWGAIGYNHLDAADKQGRSALDASLNYLAARINSKADQHGPLALTVFNPCGWRRSDLAFSGRIYPIPEKTAGVVVKDRSGRVVPSQIIKAEKDSQGNIEAAEVVFAVKDVPAVGYETHYLDFMREPAATVKSDLQIDLAGLALENEHLRVRLDPVNGGVSSLVDKRSGRETLDGKQGAFPHFTGRPNPNVPFRADPPAKYDSALSKAQIDWVAKGPLLATVRAQHQWKYLNFETRVTLAAGRPYVEVLSRVFARVPPHSDASPPDIKEGYWLSFVPAFEVTKVLRDYPLAVEETKKAAFHALTFADLLGKDLGLLVLHAGTQWFRRQENGVFSNLVMREWASHFDREYGWPIYSEYRHALMPHGGNLTNADRLRASAGFAQRLIVRAGPPRAGDLPAAKGFLALEPAGVELSAFRKKADGKIEVRAVEVNGRRTPASVETATPFTGACETNLLGVKTADAALKANRIQFTVEPWKIRTFEIET